MENDRYMCFHCKRVQEDKHSLHDIFLRNADEGEEGLLVSVCSRCLPIFREGAGHLFHILGRSAYSEEQRPTYWQNLVSLSYRHFHVAHGQLPFVTFPLEKEVVNTNELDRTQLPLAQFPLIEDFEVVLGGVIAGREQKNDLTWYEVFFFSSSLGLLTYFPNYTACQLCQRDFIIPIGDFSVPYFDFDWGWAILLAAEDEFVYVLAGRGEEGFYQTWFRVKKDIYYQQWEKAVGLCRSICQS